MRDAQSKGNIENTNKYIYYVSTINFRRGWGEVDSFKLIK